MSSSAAAASAALRNSDVGRLLLAVPVCPRDALEHLQRRYDLVVAVAKPMGRRSLTWHYADFDTIDEPEALRLLAGLAPA
jgi:putative phosphoribosyl transferase